MEGSDRRLLLCINTEKCKKRHYINECTADDEKKELLGLMYAERSEKGRSNALTTPPKKSTLLFNARDASLKKLADAVGIIVNGDYGADHSALSEARLTQCAEDGE